MTEIDDWTKQTLDAALSEVIQQGLFPHPLLQARPVWQLPGALLLAECRAGSEDYWLVAGPGSPTDLITKEAASSAGDAAKHFSLKWQLAAEQLSAGIDASPESQQDNVLAKRVSELVRNAESLHELAEADHFWR